jgi:glyceraldehyde-3-phosphate dehydrogenase (NADP+)
LFVRKNVVSIEERVGAIFPEENNIPEEFRLKAPVVQKEYLNNGDLLVWNGDMQEVISPVWMAGPSGLSQKVIGRYPLLTEKESLEALDACMRAYDNGRGRWPKMPVCERIRHVEQFLERMQERKRDIILLLMWEIGKSYEDSEKEFDRTVDYVKNTVDALKDLDRSSSQFVIEQGIIGQIRRAPLGVVLCMGPFNYPLNETFTPLIPALLMGNTAIFKPPKFGVLLHYPLLSALRDSFPPGVINTVYGDGRRVITPILSTGKVDVLAFIGSSRVADLLKSQHPRPGRLRSVLGLEAKNCAVVLPDADINLTVQECVKGSLSFNGQRCTALKILFVHSSIVGLFLENFVPAVEKLKFGMPWEKGVAITPLPERNKTGYLAGLVEDARRFGADVINAHGGTVKKTFFYPAVLYPVNSGMRIYREEQFGPVVPVVPFDDIEVPIKYIIESSYGQQASVFGNDAGTIANLVDVLVNQVCRVNINSLCQRGPDIFPFAARKDSGEGTLSVTDALRVFSIRTIVAAKDAVMNKGILEKIVRERKSNFLSTDFIP